MDFHTLARRDLQSLCKRNKIPANVTNVAMAEALKALEFVEGIEEFTQTCQSETAQSSIESPGKMEVTSPYVPPTGGRSTRRRNVVKDEPETTKPSARAPRTARKTAIETPAIVSQSSRKKVQIASVCKKMDLDSKECKDEEKSGVSATPAPSAVTTRRRRAVKEESTVSHAYSTRRSTRLAGKNVQLLNEAGSEKLDFSKKELFTNDCQEELKTISNEGPGDLDEVSGITGGVDGDITVEVKSEKEAEAEVVSVVTRDVTSMDVEEAVPAIEDDKSEQFEAVGTKLELKDACDVVIEEVGIVFETDAEVVSAEKEVQAEVVSAEKQDMSTLDLGEPEPAIEDEAIDHSEADGAKLELMDTCNVKIEEVVLGSETEAEEDKEGSNETEVVSAEKEVEAEVVSAEKQDMSTLDLGEPEPTIEDEAIYHSEADGAKLELMGTCDVKIEEVGLGSETEAEEDKEESNETESPSDKIKAEEKDGSLDFKASEIEVDFVEIERNQPVNYRENVVLDSEDKSTDEDVVPESEVSCDAQPSETKIDVEKIEQQNSDKDMESDLESEDVFTGSEFSDDESEETVSNVDADDVSKLNVVMGALEFSDDESEETVSNVDADDVSELNVIMGDLEINANVDGDSGEKEIKSDDASGSVTLDQNTDDSEINLMDEEEEEEEMKDAEVIPHLTPIKGSASKALSAKKARAPAVSDNKENNIEIGGKLAFTNTSKSNELEEKLKQMSNRKLTKMLKEKLNIANKSKLDEKNGDEAATVPVARQALQALPENRKA